MTSRHRKTLRFAVGSPDEYRSAVWRLWVHGKDVYLAARLLGSMLKLSMHRSDIWRLAWTSESGIKARHSSDRVEERWTRPPQFRPGWTQGPSVIVPNSGIELPFRRAETDLDRVIWVPTPAPGNKVHLTVLFEDQDAPPESGIEVLLPSDVEVGTLELQGGDRVRLHCREVPMAAKESGFVLPFVKNMRVNYPGGIPELVEASVYSAGTDDAGYPYLIDMVLGWENVTASGEPR